MTQYVIGLALFMHGIGHALFLANAWGYWKADAARAGLVAGVLRLSPTTEGIIGLLWLVPLVGFAAVAGGWLMQAAWWRQAALVSAAVSAIMVLAWWGSLNPSSAFFALAFDLAVIAFVVWQQRATVAM